MATDRLAALGCSTYAEYLKSPHWKGFKKRYRKSGRPQTCRVCDDNRVDLHHITYVRIGREKFKDVMPLCRECHDVVHAMLKSAGRPVQDSWWAVERLKPASPVKVEKPSQQPIKTVPHKKREKKKKKRKTKPVFCQRCNSILRQGIGEVCLRCRVNVTKYGVQHRTLIPDDMQTIVNCSAAVLMKFHRSLAGYNGR